MVLIIKGSDFYLSAHREGGARTKFLNVAAEISVRARAWRKGGLGGIPLFSCQIKMRPVPPPA